MTARIYAREALLQRSIAEELAALARGDALAFDHARMRSDKIAAGRGKRTAEPGLSAVVQRAAYERAAKDFPPNQIAGYLDLRINK